LHFSTSTSGIPQSKMFEEHFLLYTLSYPLSRMLVAEFSITCILDSLYSEHDSGSKEPSKDALKECLESMLALKSQGPIFIILDTIDECPNSAGTPSPRENVLRLVEWLSVLRYSHVSVCVTSKPEADIEAALRSLSSHSVPSWRERTK
jgi:hypothetical protein